MRNTQVKQGEEASPRFLSVEYTARELGMSAMTLYRAIRAREFPAIKIRGRLVVPAKVLDEMENAAMNNNSMVDAADWVSEEVA